MVSRETEHTLASFSKTWIKLQFWSPLKNSLVHVFFQIALEAILLYYYTNEILV